MAKKHKLPKPGRMLISSTASGLLEKVCAECGHSWVVSKNETKCPECFTTLPEEGKAVPERVEASTAGRKPDLHCGDCNKNFVVRGNTQSIEKLANTLYCPCCGSSELSVADENAKLDEPVNSESEQEDDVKKKKDKIESGTKCAGEDESGEEDKLDESDDGTPDSDDESDSDESSDDESSDDESSDDESSEDEVEDEVEDKITADLSALEASLLTIPEPSWLFTNKGKPIFKLSKSKISASAHPIFATDKFVDVFISRAQEIGFTAALKEFGAEVLDDKSFLNNLDLEQMAFEKMSSQVMPKFIECLALAVEGASKGVYPELHTSLKAAFFDELSSKGLAESDAVEAIERAFSNAGSEVFTAMIAQAQELMNKEDVVFKEIKATISASGVVKSSVAVDKDSVERKELRRKLTAGNIPIQTGEPVARVTSQTSLHKASVGSLRTKLAFTKR